MNENDVCHNDDVGCGHVRRHHQTAGTAPCRVTGCQCRAFTDPPTPAGTARRRVVFDIPDGYAATVTLHPIDTNHDGDAEA